MQDAPHDPLNRVLGELLRASTPVRELELERALARLQAARGDAAYLLLHRVLVLEQALQQLRASATAPAAGGVAGTPGAPAAPAGQPGPHLPRSVLRDAAAVALGVVAGQAIWDGLTDNSAAAGADLGSALDDWLG